MKNIFTALLPRVPVKYAENNSETFRDGEYFH